MQGFIYVLISISVLLVVLIVFLLTRLLKYKKEKDHALSELSEINEELDKKTAAIKTRDDLIGHIEREVRTPMNAISCAATLLSKEDLSDSAKSYVNILSSSSDSLVTLVNDMVEFVKLDTGRYTPVEEEYKIANLIKEITKTIANKLEDRPVAFIVDIDPTMPAHLIGDEMRLKQVLLETLTNSVKRTSSGRIEFKIKYERLSKSVLDIIFKISDTGSPVSASERKALKDRKRDDGKNSEKRDSASLGLILSKSLAEYMGGDLRYESAPGKGNVFTVRVRNKIVTDDVSICRNKVKKNFGFDVLLYEDDPYYVDGLERIFTEMGLPYHEIKNDEEAEFLLSTVKIDYAFVSNDHFENIRGSAKRISPGTTVVLLDSLGLAKKSEPSTVILKKPVTIFDMEDLLDHISQEVSVSDSDTGKLRTPGLKILLVDDSQVNLKVSKALFETFGAVVTAVDSGFEAVQLVKMGEIFDVVFLDHMMPGMDGIETLKQIREIPEYEKVPMIVLTANTGGGVEDLFFEAGFNDFIPKPIIMNRLVSIMRKWVPKDRQDYIVDKEYKGAYFNKKKDVHFKPENGMARVWNDDKIYLSVLKTFEKESPVLFEKLQNDTTVDSEKEDVAKLKALSDSAGGVKLSAILSEIMNIADIGDASLLKIKLEKAAEEYKILSGEVRAYVSEREAEDILTII